MQLLIQFVFSCHLIPQRSITHYIPQITRHKFMLYTYTIAMPYLSHWFFTAAIWVCAQVSPVGFCSTESGTGTFFSPRSSVSPVSIILHLLHTYSYII